MSFVARQQNLLDGESGSRSACLVDSLPHSKSWLETGLGILDLALSLKTFIDFPFSLASPSSLSMEITDWVSSSVVGNEV